MPTDENVDYISSCISLLEILSHLKYDELVNCMQVSRHFDDCINRSWNMMPKKTIDLNISRVVEHRTTTSHLTVAFELPDEKKKTHTVLITPSAIILSSLEPRFLKNFLNENAESILPVPRLLMKYLVNSRNEGLRYILSALLSHVTIANLKLWLPDGGNELETVKDCFSKFYSSKVAATAFCARITDNIFDVTNFTEFIGARHMKIDIDETAQYPDSSWSWLKTDKHYISMNMVNGPVERLMSLIEECKLGKRDIFTFKFSDLNHFSVDDFDKICVDLRLNYSDIHKGYFEFVLPRYIDDKKLRVMYNSKEMYLKMIQF